MELLFPRLLVDVGLERERLLVLLPRVDVDFERLPPVLLLLLELERLPLLARELLDLDFEREPDDFVATCDSFVCVNRTCVQLMD